MSVQFWRLLLFAAIANLACALQAFIFVYLSITSRYLGPVFQCSCIPISSSKYKKDTFSLYVVMHFPFQLRSITSSCPSGTFFRYSQFWLLYGFRIGSDRIIHPNIARFANLKHCKLSEVAFSCFDLHVLIHCLVTPTNIANFARFCLQIFRNCSVMYQ